MPDSNSADQAEEGDAPEVPDSEVERLKEENERLRREVERLRRENEEIERKKRDIEKEYQEYKARHPETVGVKFDKVYEIKSPTPAGPKRKPGAQPGHAPRVRRLPEKVDQVVPVPVEVCPHCGEDELSEKVQEVRSRTIEDIPVCKPKVTRYDIDRRYCRTCQKLVETPVKAAFPKCRIGIRTMLFIVYLKIAQRSPIESIPKMLETAFGIKISEGEVQRVLGQMADAFGPHYEALKDDLRNESARYIDETPWRIDGQNAYLWTFVTKWETIYTIDPSRSHEVPLGILGKKVKGTDVHDRFSAYRTLARKTGNRPQQDCWFHILGDAKELAQHQGEEGKAILATLKGVFERAKEFDHQGDEADVTRLVEDVRSLRDRTYSSSKCYRFTENLWKIRGNLFHFVTDPDVDGTNNAAERAIRPAVVIRKISGGSRSRKGADIFSVLMSMIRTFEQRGIDLLEVGPELLLTSHG